MSQKIDVSVRCILGKRTDQNDLGSKGESDFRLADRYHNFKQKKSFPSSTRNAKNKRERFASKNRKQRPAYFDSSSENGGASEEDVSFDGTRRRKPKITSVRLNDSSALRMYEGVCRKAGKFFIIAKSISEMVRDQVQINQTTVPYRIAGQSLRSSSVRENNDRLQQIQGVRRKPAADESVLEQPQRQSCMTVRKKCRKIIQQLDRAQSLVLPEMPFAPEPAQSAPTSPESSVDESEIFQDDLLFSLRFPFRYFNYPAFCETCEDLGHSRWECPLRFELEECRYCLGRHNRKACGQIGCMKCKQGGHEVKQCPLKVTSLKDDYCIRCRSWGHSDEACRTLVSRPVKQRELGARLCCVCGEQGHFEDFHFDGNIIKMFI